MLTLVWLGVVVAGFFALAYGNAAGWLWTGAIAAALAAAWGAHLMPLLVVIVLAGLLVVLAISLNFPPLRRALISDGVLAVFRRILPPMTPTEREAIEAGTVGWDAELFSGRPDWGKLLALPAPKLTAEEQHFLDHECEELCAMVTDWETTHIYLDLPQPVWQYIKDKGFLGMIIPKEYGGLGFSAFAHSQVVVKLASRCSALVVTVMVPNSLGPGELLMHYGTDEQKRYYLPRLAKGLEIPCFALTNPHAGSDAAAIPDAGIVCMGEYQGRQVLGLRVTWEK
ncbi:MAG: acyl-CoA dehydrogenase, partial [Betaproteobacteria bacterium]